MKRTTAPGSAAGLYVDDNPGLGVVGTLLIAEDKNATQEEICALIEGPGVVLSGADSGQMWKALRKAIVERSKYVGEIFSVSTKKAPVVFGTGTEDTYFPALCLTDFDTYKDITTTNWPDLVPYLRAQKSIFKEGLSGEISSPGVTNWAITGGNLATLTFTNDADHIAFLTALGEDQAIHGSFTNWRSITLALAIGTITAGTYAISAITPASRTVSFAFTAANASGAVTATAEFYTHRIPGSTTSARVFSARGMSAMGANDGNGYIVSGGLRRRGYFQGHVHFETVATSAGATPSYVQGLSGTGNTTSPQSTQGASTDGTNGTPRTGKETSGPALAVHIYIHGGQYV